MKKYFTIGETAKINRISIKTLRYYDEADVLHPAYTNEKTGYRYYAPEQFYLIDIIKYGKKLRLSLAEIKSLMGNKNVAQLSTLLQMQKKQALEEIENLTNMISSIDSTLSDLNYVTSYDPRTAPYHRVKAQKYIVYTMEDTLDLIQADLQLKRIIADKRFQPYLTYKYGFFLRTSGLRQGKIEICGECIALTQKPDFESSKIMNLTEARCACFQSPLFAEIPSIGTIRKYVQSINYSSDYVIADEIFYSPEWKDCLYELCFDTV